MASKIGTAAEQRFETSEFARGAVGGLLGGIAFGLIMQFVIPQPVLEMAIPAMYGVEGPALATGWAFHLFHAAVLGLVYVAAVRLGGIGEYAASTGTGVVLGAVYGVVVWVALAVIVMPIWLSAVGFPGAPPLPNVAPLSLVGHVVYGAVLGGYVAGALER